MVKHCCFYCRGRVLGQIAMVMAVVFGYVSNRIAIFKIPRWYVGAPVLVSGRLERLEQKMSSIN